jgi:APA family basic amino acid/polyamine antiporter
MSRDGLLPPVFSRIHPRHKTPAFATVVTGAVVAIPALFLNLKEVIELSSIGTLFAFVLVCGGVFVLGNSPNAAVRPKFKTPYINGRYIVPMLYVAATILSLRYLKTSQRDTFFTVQHVPMLVFFLAATVMMALSFFKKLSLIPVLGVVTCLYLMAQLGMTNWARFLIWLVAGLAIYFSYSRRRSKLN